MDIVRSLIILVLACCIYNILKLPNGKKSYNDNNKYLGFDYNNNTTYFGNNVKGHYRKTKSGKTTYVRAHRRRKR